MKKSITLSIALFKNGTVMLDGYGAEQTYERGTVDFTATIDGRRKTFDSMEALERAGLVTTEHDGNMFPDYKATSELHKAFNSTSLVLCFADSLTTQERLNSLIKAAGVTQEKAFTNLKNARVTAVEDVYQLSDFELKAIILK